MAAVQHWSQILNNIDIFTKLRRNLEKVKYDAESKNFVELKDGELFIWNAYNNTVLTTNLKQLVGQNQKEQSDLCQIFLCNNSPEFDVERLLFSPSGSYLALIGKRGISVLELPQKWGKHAQYEGGKERILCRAIPIAERYFLSSMESLLYAAWHPGSENDMHLVLLTSDDTIRIYNINCPESAEQVHRFGDSDNYNVNNRLRTLTVLGDSAVSFDFGPPVQAKPRRRGLGVKNTSATSSDNLLYLWPMYILLGNGDVYVLNTTVSTQSHIQQEIEGPLSMYPPDEDNSYGTDACSITCLYTKPPTLVIATSEGKLHHCVVLSVTDGQDDTKSEISIESGDSSQLYEAPRISQKLYVYETVELELSLTSPVLEMDEAGVMPDLFSCPIRLHKDISCSDRYHCSHSAGVHTVVLPWQQKIQQFCEQDEGTDPPPLSESEHSLVEHLVCTKPLPSSPACPILGLCMTADRLLGTHLLCLTQSFECLALPLFSHYKTPAPALISDHPTKTATSPFKHLRKEMFDAKIKRILQRNVSNPLIKTSSSSELSPEECYQVLTRTTQVFREEYIQKQVLAKEEIDKKVRILREHKELQISDLHSCEERRKTLRRTAESLADKYEDAKERQEDLYKRLESVIRKLQCKLPVLTDAEKNMQSELKTMEEQLNLWKGIAEQAKAKKEYQSRKIEANKANTNIKPLVNKTQTQHLRTVLKQEGDDITELVKDINQMKLVLET